MRPSELVVRAFDGSRQTVIGEVNLLIKITPHTFFITFFMMGIHPTYSCLLGRAWIHSSRVVTSMLYQSFKCLVINKLVVIEGKEDIKVSPLASFWYIEGGREVQEIPFQSFEVFNVDMVGSIGEVKIV